MNSKKLAKAVQFATIAHDGAYRKGTKIPYVAHVIEAGLIAMTLTDDEDIIIAAILHDVVEDTSFKLADIEKPFGSRVAELVSHESEDKMHHISASDSWKIRKEAFLNHLSNTPIEAKIIYLSDKLSNMRLSIKTFDKRAMICGLSSIRKIKKSRNGITVAYTRACQNLMILLPTRNM